MTENIIDEFHITRYFSDSDYEIIMSNVAAFNNAKSLMTNQLIHDFLVKYKNYYNYTIRLSEIEIKKDHTMNGRYIMYQCLTVIDNNNIWMDLR